MKAMSKIVTQLFTKLSAPAPIIKRHFILRYFYRVMSRNIFIRGYRFASMSITFLLAIASMATAQVPGCTDPMANNYNASATVNNGSCTYNTTAYTPPIKSALSDTLIETSGLQWAGNSLWSFNDGGGLPAIYRVDTSNGSILQTVHLQGASNIDWEDIAFDGLSFYVGDFGNNANGARTDLTIYKFPFTAIPDQNSFSVTTIPSSSISVLRFSYNDQPQPPQPTAANATNFDCEAMLVDEGKIHLFSKRWLANSCTHYLINDTVAGNYIATAVETLSTNFLVTAADKAPGQQLVVLLGYQVTGAAPHFMQLLSAYNSGFYFNGNKRTINLPDVTVMGQAEGISFRNSYAGFISNEKFMRTVMGFPITVPQRLRSFDIRNFVSDLRATYIFSGNGNWSASNNWTNNARPVNPLTGNSQVIVDPLPGGQCLLDIPFTITAGTAFSIGMGKRLVISSDLIIE